MNAKLKGFSILLVGAMAVTSCQQGQQQAAMPVAQYEMLSIENGTCEYTKESSATIRGRQDIDIVPQVGGTLTSILVKEGDKVRKGQVMFVIDQIPYKAAVKTAEATVATAKANLATSELTLKSKSELYKANVVSEFDYTTAKNAVDVAEAQLADAEARLVSANNDYSYTSVKSPVDGVIGVLPYREGALVSSAIQTPLTTVSDNSVMQVYFSMAENELLSLVREHGSRDKALKNMPAVSLKLSDGSMYDIQGKVVSISGVIDRSTGTVTLRADFKNPNGLLHSGATGNVVTPTTRENVVTIPVTATYEIQNKVFVFQNIDGKATSKLIEVTRAFGTNIYIVESGLVAGDKIVAEGVGLLREGTPIADKMAAPAAASAPTSDAAAE